MRWSTLVLGAGYPVDLSRYPRPCADPNAEHHCRAHALANCVNPAMLLPGRAMLSTKPLNVLAFDKARLAQALPGRGHECADSSGDRVLR